MDLPAPVVPTNASVVPAGTSSVTPLIAPALARLGIDGGTTGEIVRAGNIREDMFQLLLTADLVIADLSIDNANVFAVLMDAVRVCSLGQITHALFEVGGQYRRSM